MQSRGRALHSASCVAKLLLWHCTRRSIRDDGGKPRVRRCVCSQGGHDSHHRADGRTAGSGVSLDDTETASLGSTPEQCLYAREAQSHLRHMNENEPCVREDTQLVLHRVLCCGQDQFAANIGNLERFTAGVRCRPQCVAVCGGDGDGDGGDGGWSAPINRGQVVSLGPGAAGDTRGAPAGCGRM